ncbi:MAG: ABC transporter permease [Burkholderiales bacterium]|nr:ABC transporter permease [Burkholderiales bacterium]
MAAWELIGRFLVANSLFLATPLQAVEALGNMWIGGELQRHIWSSTQEFVIGFLIGSASGIAIGLAIATSRNAAAIFNPWVAGLYSTPIVALAPLMILWFGIGIWSKVAVVISVVVFPVMVNTESGIRATSPHLIEVARSLCATRWQIFAKVSIPSAMPYILAGLRLGIGRGLIGVVIGEFFGARAGVGYLIVQSAEAFNMPAMFAGVIIFAAAGIGLTAAFQALEHWLLRWR